MDASSLAGVRVLNAMAESARQAETLARTLKERAEAVEVLQDLRLWPRSRAGSGDGAARGFVEWYVDAELRSGIAVSWGIVVQWDDSGWTVEAPAMVVLSEGSACLDEFPVRTATTIGGLIQAVEAATAAVIASGLGRNLAKVQRQYFGAQYQPGT